MQSQTYTDFSGGLNNRANPAAIAENQSPLCSNVDLDEYGKIQKRRGSKYLFGTAKSSPITWLQEFRLASGTTKLLYTSGTTLNACDIDGTNDTAITGALTLTSGKNVLSDATYCTLSGAPIIVGTNDTDNIWYWTGTGNAAVLSTQTYMPTAAKCVELLQDRLILANIVDRGSGARYTNYFTWSAANDPTDWDTDAHILIGSAEDPIIAVIKAQKAIVVLKEHSTWRVYWDLTLATFVPQIINPKVGCAARNSVAASVNEVFFLSQDGVYQYDGRGTDEESLVKISDNLEAEAWETNWHTARKDKANAVFYRPRNQYRIFIAEGETAETADENRTYYAYHPKFKAWTKGTHEANCSTVVQDGSRYRLYVGDYDGQINRLDYFDTDDGAYVDNDNGSAISSHWYTKDHNMGYPNLDKGWAQLTVVMSTTSTAQTLAVTQFNDYGDYSTADSLSMQAPGAVLDDFVLDVDRLGGGTTKKASMPLMGYSDVTRLKFENNNLNEHFSILGYSLKYDPAESY